ncbi:MAG: hypothetical protein H7336_06730 [Bacteriovorax sp.]|nr:hypothetical protein [Bacteriovorax sp.]
MAFKDIHKLKKIAVVERETISVPYLIVGKDIFSLSLYNELKKVHGGENVRLLSQDALLKSDLLPKGPSSIRGETNQRMFKDLFPDVALTKCNENSFFYKDMSWKSFGGRSKSEVLKYDEGFYTGDRIDPDFTEVFKNISMNDEYIKSINAEAYQVKLKSIARNDEGFIVECINGTEFHSKNLYFGLSPYHYLEYYTDKNQLSDSFIEFCESTKTSSALFVKFVFEDRPLSDKKETIFIPLSYTHDWGHFIGEFKSVDGVQEIEFMHFLEDHLMSEEDVSRVIRLLKKSMEKIFEDFLKIKVRDFISLEQEIGCLKIDDGLFAKSMESVKDELKNLSFIGINAPVTSDQRSNNLFEYSGETLNGVMRGLVVQANHTKKFE